MCPSTSTRSTCPVPTFAGLGVRTLINGRGTYTVISGSRLLDTAAAAMVEASNGYVQMDELMLKVGERLAELTGAEWGYVSCGCAAALAEVAAACVTEGDPEKMARLPLAEGMKDEIIIQAGQRVGYDRAVRMTGARMVEITTPEELEAAFSERTAMVFHVGDAEASGQIPPEQVIAAAHRHGVPVLVDAAAQRPDVPNRYLQMGADAVAYSGGKCLRGPQASGLVLGKKPLLWTAFMNAAPHGGLGRPMKAGKEEIMGLLAAVEAWVLGRDHAAEWRTWEGYLECVRAAVAGLPSVTTAVEQPGIANVAPFLHVSWQPQTLGCTPAQVCRALAEGEPAILVHQAADGVRVNPYMLETGDAEIIAAHLRAQLSAPRPLPLTPDPVAPAVDLSGSWTIVSRYSLGSARHDMTIAQQGTSLTGTYRSPYTATSVEGEVRGRDVTLRVTLGYGSNMVGYVYQGALQPDGTMSGSVAYGWPEEGTWVANRLG